jgi:hypothetical protein
MQELQLARGAWLLDAVTHHSVTREGTQGDLAKLTAQKDDVSDPCDSAVLAQALGYTLLRLASCLRLGTPPRARTAVTVQFGLKLLAILCSGLPSCLRLETPKTREAHACAWSSRRHSAPR